MGAGNVIAFCILSVALMVTSVCVSHVSDRVDSLEQHLSEMEDR